MYQYLLNMWVMRRVTGTQIDAFVAKGYISREEADAIIATPQVAPQVAQ